MKKFLTILFAGLLLTSCQSKESCSSQKPKEINVYTALENEQIPVFLENFKKHHPDIKLNITRDSTGVLITKILAEKDNPQADVVWGTATTGLLMLDKENLLKPYAPKGLEKVDPKFKDSAEEPVWVGNNAWMATFAVNKTELEKLGLPIPRTYEDLLNPGYKGLISMPHPTSSGTGFLAIAGFMQVMGEKEAWEYMEKLHENMGVYTHSGSKPAKQAASGEYPIGISYDYPSVKLMNEGNPIEVVFPAEGSGWDSEANALINKKDIKEESKVFLDWAISEEMMKLYGTQYAITSIDISNPIPNGYPSDPVSHLVKNDFKWLAENKNTILDKWSEKFGAKAEQK